MRRKGEQNTNNKNRLESNFACEQYALQFNFCKYSGLNLNQDKAASRRQYK